MELLNFEGLTEDEIKRKCQELFQVTYVCDPEAGIVSLKTTDGVGVRFYRNAWWHAISYEDKRLRLRKVSRQRSRRLLWPKLIITGCAESRFADVTERGTRKRYYYVEEERYALVLKYKKNNELVFCTHFLCYIPEVEEKMRRRTKAKK